MTNYRLHSPLIDRNTNKTYQPGLYSDKEIDVLEAKRLNIITLAKSPEQTKVETKSSFRNSEKFVGNFGDVKLLNSDETVTSIDMLKINKLTKDELKKIPRFGDTMVARLMANRPFSSYEDMDIRCPLSNNRKWQNMVIISFEGAPSKPERLMNVFK